MSGNDGFLVNFCRNKLLFVASVINVVCTFIFSLIEGVVI